MKFDTATISFADKLDERGYLPCTLLITRIGNHQGIDDDGNVVEIMRHPDELFKEESLETLKNCPITNEHPVDHEGNPVFLDSSNTGDYQIGYTGEQLRIVNNSDIECNGVLTNKWAIQEALGQKRGVSTGFKAKTCEKPGSYSDENGNTWAYERFYQDIKYNHVCITTMPRIVGMGLKFDSSGIFIKEALKMVKKLIDGETFEVPEGLSLKLDSLLARPEKSKLDEALGQIAALELARKDLSEKLKKAESDLESASCPKKIDSIVNERMSLIQEISAHMPEDFKYDGLSNDEIKLGFLKTVHPEVETEGKSPEFLKGMYSMVRALSDKSLKTDSALGNQLITDPNTAQSSSAAKAFENIKNLNKGG